MEERIKFGTVEVPKLAKNSIKIDNSKLRHKKLDLKVPEVKEKKLNIEYIEPNLKKSKDKILLGTATVKGKLKLERATHKQTAREYRKITRKQHISSFKKRRRLRYGYRMTRALFNDENIKEDELDIDIKTATKRWLWGSAFTIRHQSRKLKKFYNIHSLIKENEKKERLLKEQRKRILSKSRNTEYRDQIKSVSSKIQKKRLKQEMVAEIKAAEGNFIRRNMHWAVVKIKSTNRRIRMVKRIISTVFSVGMILLTFVFLLAVGFILILAMVNGMGEYSDMAITQNDYGVLSETTAYLKKLETDLEEELNDKETLERELQEKYGPDIYEFHYDLANLGFNNNTLMAYLSAKYDSFYLENITGELEKLFLSMYEIKIEVKEELRQVPAIDAETGEHLLVWEMKKICYITLEKTELEEVVEGRMNEEEKKKYDMYKISSGGQQVYGSVMQEDWTSLISSDYGERIHPITGERSFHNGIDIAVPTGTSLYSAVTGTVILAKYSESAGNYMKVQTESGWIVTFMHMESLAVLEGEKIKKGDFVGYSGNTGNSTGPHLHLEVRDSQGNTVNPYFIVPQNCYQIKEDEG